MNEQENPFDYDDDERDPTPDNVKAAEETLRQMLGEDEDFTDHDEEARELLPAFDAGGRQQAMRMEGQSDDEDVADHETPVGEYKSVRAEQRELELLAQQEAEQAALDLKHAQQLEELDRRKGQNG